MSTENMELWRVYMYLRKSRQDERFETESIEATLERHNQTLTSVAKKMNLNIVKVYKEVMTGDSIAARPQMLELLADVEEDNVDAVLVMDIDRLGRGDLQDQGYIFSLFKRKSVKIITPGKVYNMEDETDEDMIDFKAFFARKELIMIKRRFARGKQASLNQGNYIGTNAPYGYRKEKKTLFIVEEEAKIVRLMFDLYVNQGYGDTRITRYLKEHGISSRSGKEWERTTIRRMINNPIYIGKVAWNKRCFQYENGSRASSTLRPIEEWNIYDGRHKAIISEETFWKAQKLAKERIVPHSYSRGLSNPLAYIMKCGACGYTMNQRVVKNKKPSIRCHKHCGGVMSTYTHIVEEQLLDQLKEALQDLQWEYQQIDVKSQLDNEADLLRGRVSSCQQDIEKLKQKRLKQYDLLEEGVYSSDEFLQRSKTIAAEIEDRVSEQKKLEEKTIEIMNKKEQSENVLPHINSAIAFIDSVYWHLDAEHRNQFLKGIIDKTIYHKPKGSEPLDFKLAVFLKL